MVIEYFSSILIFISSIFTILNYDYNKGEVYYVLHVIKSSRNICGEKHAQINLITRFILKIYTGTHGVASGVFPLPLVGRWSWDEKTSPEKEKK